MAVPAGSVLNTALLPRRSRAFATRHQIAVCYGDCGIMGFPKIRVKSHPSTVITSYVNNAVSLKIKVDRKIVKMWSFLKNITF